MYTTTPRGARLAGIWDILEQVAQAGADYVTQEATGVPTYGGSPAYPIGQGSTYSPEPAPVVVEESRTPGWVMPAAVGAGALVATKLLGIW